MKAKFRPFPEKRESESRPSDLVGLLACPTCFTYLQVSRKQWNNGNGDFLCPNCSLTFTVKNKDIV